LIGQAGITASANSRRGDAVASDLPRAATSTFSGGRHSDFKGIVHDFSVNWFNRWCVCAGLVVASTESLQQFDPAWFYWWFDISVGSVSVVLRLPLILIEFTGLHRERHAGVETLRPRRGKECL